MKCGQGSAGSGEGSHASFPPMSLLCVPLPGPPVWAGSKARRVQGRRCGDGDTDRDRDRMEMGEGGGRGGERESQDRDWNGDGDKDRVGHGNGD